MTFTPFARLQTLMLVIDRADFLTVGAGVSDQGACHGPGDAVHALETGQPQAVEPAYRLAQVFGSPTLDFVVESLRNRRTDS